MNAFADAAQDMHLWSAAISGAMFGVFLTLGEAWTQLLDTTITVSIPDDAGGHVVLASVVYALASTALCTLALFAIVSIDRMYHSVWLPKRTLQSRRDTLRHSQVT